MPVRRGATLHAETGVRLAVVDQVTDAVDRILEDRCGREDEDTDTGVDEGDRVEGGDEAGKLADVAQVFECFHGTLAGVSTGLIAPSAVGWYAVGMINLIEPAGGASGGRLQEARQRLDIVTVIVDRLDVEIEAAIEDPDSGLEEIKRLQIRRKRYCCEALELMNEIDELLDPELE